MIEYFEKHEGNFTGELPKEYFKFDYPLDHFQLYGCQAIDKNENILVTAHTGSGKTALALYGIARTLSMNKKVIYTSPIKTLSNQKYAEFSNHFDSVGIMTGDVKINPIANLLIMTAEILRNSILKNNNNVVEDKISWTFDPNEVGCVILDEVHFINNQDRGTVWEEIIINLSSDIQLIMLSASVTNPDEMALWIGNLKKIKCHLMTTYKRPVPLQHGIWWDNEITYFLYGDNNWTNNIWSDIEKKINKYYKYNKFTLNMFFSCIKYLYDNNMTPANIFLLNRILIEKYAKKIPYYFVNSEEAANISNIWNFKLRNYKNIYDKTTEWNELYSLVIKGIGIHHSGMIPILKEIVEILYEKGLIKILLATETFAMGVNMPTKTVVFTQLTKYDGNESKRLLKSEEYGQMAGRAGRRGKDPIGHVLILPFNDFITEYEAKIIILSSPQNIRSKLNINPIFVLKHLSIITDNDIKQLYTNSLFNYQSIKDNDNLKYKYELISNKIEKYEKEHNIDSNLLNEYYKIIELNEKLKPNGFIKLAHNIEKKIKNEIKNLLDLYSNNNINFLKIIDTYILIHKDFNNIKIKIDEYESKMNNQIQYILDFLKNNNYITIIDSKYQLTKIGKIISDINECNPFIINYIISNNLFDNIEFNEIVAICSIFINENKSNEEIYISDLNCSDKCRDILYNIEKKIGEFYKLEDNLNKILPYPCYLDWSINYTMFNTVIEWADNNNIDTSFYGNFIKTILRITQLIRNIESIAISINNIDLINKLNGYLEKLIRDIVTTDSLYLK